MKIKIPESITQFFPGDMPQHFDPLPVSSEDISVNQLREGVATVSDPLVLRLEYPTELNYRMQLPEGFRFETGIDVDTPKVDVAGSALAVGGVAAGLMLLWWWVK